MKKLLIICFLLFVFTSTTSGFIFVRGGGSDAADPDIKFWWRCESATLSTGDYSANDQVGTETGSPAYNSDAGHVGTNGLDCSDGQKYVCFDIPDTAMDTDIRVGFWWDAVTFSTGEVVFFAFDDDKDWDNFIELKLTGDINDVEITLKHEGNNDGGERTVSTVGANMDPGNAGPYFIEFGIDQNADDGLNDNHTMEILVDGTEYSSAFSTAIQSFGTEIATFCFGTHSAGTYDWQLDHLLMSVDPSEDFSSHKNTDDYPW
ncbi:MAG: hypothetical protein GWN00_21140 [Aliifodinibius sp.]|nr:hypothetical protein [Fodinibius sp.]NIY27220.1 hypothetical protein [Fodinibius sp.]